MLERREPLLSSKTRILVSGILFSLLLLVILGPSAKKVRVPEISYKHIKQYVSTEGRVEDLYKSENFTVFKLTANNDSIKAVAFKKLSLNEGEQMEVTGQVKLYQKKLEIVLKEVK